jgi:DNA-binding transcriptional ArsR family regulator
VVGDVTITVSTRSGGGRTRPRCGTSDVTVATLSHHLRVLRESGVTSTRVDGKYRFISLRLDDLDARFPGVTVKVVSRDERVPRTANMSRTTGQSTSHKWLHQQVVSLYDLVRASPRLAEVEAPHNAHRAYLDNAWRICPPSPARRRGIDRPPAQDRGTEPH